MLVYDGKNVVHRILVISVILLIVFLILVPNVYAQDSDQITIVVHVFSDTNGNGSIDAGEMGISGIGILVTDSRYVPAATMVTNGIGIASFTDVPYRNGSFVMYVLRILSIPDNYAPTTATTIIVQVLPGNKSDVFFGLKPVSSSPTPTPTPTSTPTLSHPPSSNFDISVDASVCLKYWDGKSAILRFGHSVLNHGPDSVTGIRVDLKEHFISGGSFGNTTNIYWDTTKTISLAPGKTWEFYRDVTINGVQGNNWVFRGSASSNTVANLRILNPPTPIIPEINLSNNATDNWLDDVSWCPGYGPASAVGYVFIDKNGNGRKDPNEPGIKNAVVQLWQGSTLKARSTASWPSGSFSVKPPVPGTYSISVVVPSSSVGGSVLWTTPRAYYGITLSGGGTRGPFYFGVRPAPPSPPKAYYSAPTLRIETSPRYPVVVGQDPNARGADISVVVTSPPALFEWYEWDDAQGKYVKHQEKVPVPVVPGSVELYGSLTAASQDWVRLDLGARYPGADVRKSSWDMGRDVGLRVVENRTLADGTTILRATAFRVPFVDPGTYTLRASAKVRSVRHAKTGLTVPQRTVSGNGTVQVYVKDSTLR